MSERNVIEVPLPYEANPSREDLELLEATFRAIVDLRYPATREWEKVEEELNAEGWTMRVALMWVAEASKGREFERAVGRTKDEAFAELRQLTRMDEPAGVP